MRQRPGSRSQCSMIKSKVCNTSLVKSTAEANHGSSSSKLGIKTSHPASTSSLEFRKRNATKWPLSRPAARIVPEEALLPAVAFDSSPPSLCKSVQPFSRSLRSTGTPKSMRAESEGTGSPFISTVFRDLRASRSFSLTAARGSCGWRERRTVVLCFLNRRVVARELGFACFGGCTSRVNQRGSHSSRLYTLTYHFAELRL